MVRHSCLVAAAVLLAVPSLVEAQSSSLFGNRGVNASSGTLNNGVGAGANAGGGNNQSFGNSGAMTGFTGVQQGTQQGFASGAAVSGGLAGTGNNGNFVGNRNSAAAAAGGSYGARGQAGRGGLTGGRNSLGSGLNRMNNGQRNRNQQGGAAGGAQSTPIRPVQVIAFAPPVKTGTSIQASVAADIASAVSQGRIPGVAVTVDNQGTATIQGHVATEGDRLKAERLVQLEPGVRKVLNQITVAEQP